MVLQATNSEPSCLSDVSSVFAHCSLTRNVEDSVEGFIVGFYYNDHEQRDECRSAVRAAVPVAKCLVLCLETEAGVR